MSEASTKTTDIPAPQKPMVIAKKARFAPSSLPPAARPASRATPVVAPVPRAAPPRAR